MISAEHVRTLFDYDAWATTRVLDAAEGLAPAELGRELVAGLPPLLPTLAHTLAAQVVWRRRWEGQPPTALRDAVDAPTLAALRERWAAEAAAWRARLDGLDDAALGAPLHYGDSSGRPFSTPLWQILVHVVNHGTQHRSEAAAMLTALGRSPGDLDMIRYFRTRA